MNDGTTGRIDKPLVYKKKRKPTFVQSEQSQRFTSSKSTKSVKTVRTTPSHKFEQTSGVIAAPSEETSKLKYPGASKSKIVGSTMKSKTKALKSEIMTTRSKSRYTLAEVRSATKSVKTIFINVDTPSKTSCPFPFTTVEMNRAIRKGKRDIDRKHVVTNEITRTKTSWLDRISKPKRMDILNVYENFGSILSIDRYERVKDILEDEYFLTPVQAEQYFERLRKAEKEKRLKLIKNDFMIVANSTTMKIIMSEKMRAVSDQLLEDLCRVLQVKVPSRNSKDKLSQYFICFVDWVAVWIENIAYEVQVESLKENFIDIDTVEEYQK